MDFMNFMKFMKNRSINTKSGHKPLQTISMAVARDGLLPTNWAIGMRWLVRVTSERGR